MRPSGRPLLTSVYQIAGIRLHAEFPMPGLRPVGDALSPAPPGNLAAGVSEMNGPAGDFNNVHHFPLAAHGIGGCPDVLLFKTEEDFGDRCSLVWQWRGRYNMALSQLKNGWLYGTPLHGAVAMAGAGDELLWYPGDAGHDAAQAFLTRRVLPRVANFHGLNAYHSAAVCNATCSVLLLGESGAGKSTLAVAISQKPGWNLLCEDISVVSNDSPPVVFPGPAGCGLWPDSCRGLGLPAGDCHEMEYYDGKCWYGEAHPDYLSSKTLAGLVFLRREPDIPGPVLEPLSQSAVLASLVNKTIMWNPDRLDRRAMLRAAAHLTRRTPAFLLRYRGGYENLPEVGDKLCEAFAA